MSNPARSKGEDASAARRRDAHPQHIVPGAEGTRPVQIDNVKIDIPEPMSLALLAPGALLTRTLR
ncbi:MAG: hypothetical protein CMJ18_09235 [Phycisphaeraceae bacterium]|nr:hypothetical protein [Phycisphaeraceae bacterium]